MNTLKDIVAQLDFVDDEDVLEKAKSNTALAAALDLSRPANWRGTGLKPDQLLPVAEAGIPVVSVPGGDVLRQLAAAQEHQYLDILQMNEASIVSRCREVLGECDDAWITDSSPLLGRAIDAFEADHFEAAMALAVALGEPLAIWASERRVQVCESEAHHRAWEATRHKERYKLAALELKEATPSGRRRLFDVPRRALISPIPKFFTPFFPKQGQAIPPTVSRHATVHQPVVEHLNRTNALLAIMLATSLLNEQQSWCIDVRMDDALAGEGDDG